MANIFKNPTHVAQMGYNSFPMRQRKQFSSTIGHILPLYYDYLNPGDKVDCSANMFTRFMPMVTPPFVSVEEHIDWFFVPLEQIYSYFGDAFYGIQDFKNDFVGSTSTLNTIKQLPAFGTVAIQNWFKSAWRGGNVNDATAPEFNADSCVILRMLDSVGYPVKTWLESLFRTSSGSDLDVQYLLQDISLWVAAAYQKVWSDYYRLSDWQENNSALYNFDSFVLNSTNRANVTRFADTFTLHRAPYKRDYFTYVFPSPLFGARSLGSFGSTNQDSAVTAVNQWLSGMSSVTTESPGSTNPSTNTSTPTTVVPSVNSGTGSILLSNLTTSNLRTIFAAEKLLEINRRAGKHYDAQTLAHFGINVPNGISGECMFLGGQTGRVNIDDVFATAQTDSTVGGNTYLTPLGQMAGKAYGLTRQNGVKFEAKCHGVLLAVYYAIPDIVYEQSGIDRLNSYVRPQDWFHPEYDDLGMQPLFGYETGDSRVTSGDSAILSWKYRYSELKSKYNIAFGSFIGDYHNWTLTKRPYRNTATWADFTCDSTLLNDFMVTPYTGQVEHLFAASDITIANGEHNGDLVYNTLYQRDPLLHDCMISVNKASKMSVFGLPSL